MKKILNKNIEELLKTSTNSADLKKMMDGKVNIFNYPMVCKMKNIEELFVNDYPAIILYLQSETYGHWISIFKLNNNMIEYFDPYGAHIDNPLLYIHKDDNKLLKQSGPILAKLMMNSNYKLSFNHVQFQAKDGNTTCGPHCVSRLKLKFLSLKKYEKFFKDFSNICSPDVLVCVITYYNLL